MDRLTIRNSNRSVSQSTSTAMEKLFDRLAEYEDTGLTPEEVEELKKRYFEVVVERDRLKGENK